MWNLYKYIYIYIYIYIYTYDTYIYTYDTYIYTYVYIYIYHFDLFEKINFLFSIFLFFYLGIFFEIIHVPLSLEEGTLAEDDSRSA